MNAMMLIHTAPHPRKNISPRRLEALEEKYEVEAAEALAWLLADAPERPFTVVGCAAVRRWFSPSAVMAAAAAGGRCALASLVVPLGFLVNDV
jgi:predicted phage tail protein